MRAGRRFLSYYSGVMSIPSQMLPRRRSLWIPATLVVLAAALSVPSAAPDPGPSELERAAFVWDQDSLWHALERNYARLRGSNCDLLQPDIDGRMDRVRGMLRRLRHARVAADALVLDSLETATFQLAPLVASCPSGLSRYVDLYAETRRVVKLQSRGWDVGASPVRDRLYRALYGGRAAVEEVMLQHPDRIVTLLPGVDEPSATPSVVFEGVRIHSGDILVSRGGYPTSALISRGSDYPGNFSHVALVHIDESGVVSIIEAHIEIGVAIADTEKYLADKKLRIMLLRPRANLPVVQSDPQLPHRAASLALARARERHIAYDFEMDYTEPSKLFCSEVASAVYKEFGLDLWMGISTISSPGLRRWLAGFGVTHFETQEPSDLEYDPQLTVVAEWRDAETLMGDHVDNAVTDAMLEGAEGGDRLEYPWYQLPVGRIVKGYSVVREMFGSFGPVPEGMSASAALRNKAYSARHDRLSKAVLRRATEFTATEEYPPPYWKLLDMARAEVE